MLKCQQNIVGIFTFTNMIKTLSESLKAGPGIVYTVQDSGKVHAQLNWA